jgi:tetratricopeptide (TPR) repeat protein
MSFDKLKAMRSAERFLTQGKINDAIKEYLSLVENDPKDFNTMNMLGDLFVKVDDKPQAVVYFTKVAEHYSKQGFAQKAIAVYNKVAKLTPNSIDISAKLAPLYHLKGSIADAKTHYSIVAENYQNEGKKVEALNIWKKIAELDPNNTEIYLKLAEGYWNENQKDEAAASFIEAATRLASIRKHEQAVEAFSRALEIKPTDYIALNGFVASQIACNRADDACDFLQRSHRDNPYNSEILSLLADCYIGVDNPVEAEKVVITLVEKEPANYSKFLEVVSSYLKESDIDSAIRVLSMASEHLLVGGKADEYRSVTEELLTRNPEHLEGLRLLVRFHGWMRDEVELKKALERMADSAQINNVPEDEKYALSQLVNIPPFDPKYAQRLEEIGGPVSAEQLSLENVGLAATVVENEVPQFETFDALERNGEPVVEAKSNSFDFAISADTETFEQTGVPESDANSDAAAELQAEKLSPSLEMHLHQELESVDFYISNDYSDLAIETLTSLENQFGKHSEIQKRKVQLGIITPEFLDTVAENNPPVDVEPVEVDEEEELVGATKTEINEFDSSQNGFSVESFSQTDEVAFESNASDFTTEEHVEETSEAPEESNESIVEAESQAELVSESDNQFQDFASDLGFEEQEESTDGDFETHLNFGIAYKEMGLLDQSAAEFQEAVKLVNSNDGTRRHFQCCNWLGHCFIEKQMPSLALVWFEKCFETPGLSDEESRGLYYEVAMANELEGEKENAIKYYEQIYGEDISYRDVGERLKNLQA